MTIDAEIRMQSDWYHLSIRPVKICKIGCLNQPDIFKIGAGLVGQCSVIVSLKLHL